MAHQKILENTFFLRSAELKEEMRNTSTVHTLVQFAGQPKALLYQPSISIFYTCLLQEHEKVLYYKLLISRSR
jgi:hypothetical protein